ncbi:MvdC/MvdD family ATP grasp protein [Actinomadura atramentaria]|uniref:MvdC/MvdD family ATP grasp protein n=1 Tax=Actinomadura atramentaria TaxID=1990 RepID=UPI00036DF86C|nr:hypothetical protein [Actinomadura atramentaria]
MGGTVLIVARPGDPSSDLVVRALRDRGVRVARFDLGDPGVRLTAELSGGRWVGELGDGHRAVLLEDVVAVFWRWPTRAAGAPAVSDPAARRWAGREDSEALHGVLRTLRVRWINHPDRVAVANSKPLQLAAAHAAGLTVPATLITNTARSARHWSADGRALYKAFYANGPDDTAMIYAGPVAPASIPPQLHAAGTFQRIINGDHIRVTVAGPRMFAVSIHGATRLDWRGHRDVTYTPVEIPAPVQDRITRYMTGLGLEYGAFDFIRRTDDWVFLECNPTGMWGFVEFGTAMPITDAIAGRLLDPLDPKPQR